MRAAFACQSTNWWISSLVSARGISKCVNFLGTADGPTACSPWIAWRGAEVPLCIICANTLLPPSWMAVVSLTSCGMYLSSVSMAP